MTELYRRGTFLFGVLAILLGIAIVVQTARVGGGTVGYLFGLLFVALGCGRLYLLRRPRR